MGNPEFNINLTPTSDKRPGYAIFRLPKKWQGSKSAVAVTIAQNSKYLQPPLAGSTYIWDTKQEKITLENFTQNGEFYEIELNPEIVDALVAATAQTSAIMLHDQEGNTLEGRINIKQGSGIFASTAAANTNAAVTPAPESEPDPTPAPEPAPIAAEPAPAPAPAPTPTPTSTPKNNNLKILLITLIGTILALLLIGAALWWWLTKNHNNDTDPLGRPLASATANLACDVSQLGNRTDLVFIQDCLAANPSSQELLETIAQAKKANQCSIAQRLYANKSQSGDVVIASAYVKEYDPKFHKTSGCFTQSDVDTAVYWYEVILSNDPTNKEAQARLEALKQ